MFEYSTRMGLQSYETFHFFRDYDRSQAALRMRWGETRRGGTRDASIRQVIYPARRGMA